MSEQKPYTSIDSVTVTFTVGDHLFLNETSEDASILRATNIVEIVEIRKTIDFQIIVLQRKNTEERYLLSIEDPTSPAWEPIQKE
jgi:hypothetical protein